MNQNQPRRTAYTDPPATLADHEAVGFRLTPICRRCWHQGSTMTPREFAERFAVPMTASHPELERRLRCSACGERAGYFALENPHVRGTAART
jgi:hypothetical protein